jgi:hypothetical protein
MKHIYVVCGCSPEFSDFILAVDPGAHGTVDFGRFSLTLYGTRYIYVQDRRQMLGVHRSKVIFYGTYYNRPDLKEIEALVPVVESQ